ncbi:hypothetical protein RCH21_002807 [Arthrobacter sp. PL16]|uniref:ApeA N-terminal domain 1-containing protein n=1 Tax=Arthrobacter sp. PL16 TaxID=3071720 RepID=UPI002DF7D5B9|nr:hypothetical protein [Arthrobacter sp. PL16]
MPENELTSGEPRLGWLVDGDPGTESGAVMLQDTGNTIDLTVPLRGMFDENDPYGRWWSSGVHFGDDPDRIKHSYKPPRVLLLEDARGSVVLVGCRSTGSTSNFDVGLGHIVANYAVLGGSHLRYEKVDGLRTEIPAMAAWTRLSSIKIKIESNEKNRIQSVQMTLANAEPIALARPMNLMMRSSWRTERPSGGFLAYEGVELETSVDRARPWEEHLQIHGAVLDLVSVAAWKSFGISSTKVRRIDDPHRNLAGGDMGERWLAVATYRLPKHDGWTKDPHFLFPYGEVANRGVSRWLRLRKKYGRVVGPLNILRSDDPWGHPSVVQSGIALEALGYLIDVEKNNGASLNSRKQMNFKPGLRVILADMQVSPFADTEGWIERADAAYMGAKHPDRPEPDSLTMLNTLRENLLVLCFWIGLQLGVKPKSLVDALRMDALAQEFILAG